MGRDLSHPKNLAWCPYGSVNRYNASSSKSAGNSWLTLDYNAHVTEFSIKSMLASFNCLDSCTVMNSIYYS